MARDVSRGVCVSAVALALAVAGASVAGEVKGGVRGGEADGAAAAAATDDMAGPRIGEWAVVHHTTWLHRSPDEASPRWADDRGRADNQTDYLVFEVTDRRAGWVELAAIDRLGMPIGGGSAICYGGLDGMASLGLRLWVRDDRLRTVTRASIVVEGRDGTRLSLRAGVVVEPGAAGGGAGSTIHEYGLRIPARVPTSALARSFVAEVLEPGEPSLAMGLAPDTAVRFDGAPLSLDGAVGVLWLDGTTAERVEVSTRCGVYRLRRERAEVTVSSPPPVSGALVADGSGGGATGAGGGSMEGVGLLMIRSHGDGEGGLADVLAGEAGIGEALVAVSPGPEVAGGTPLVWPDGTPAGRLAHPAALSGATPVADVDGRPCYRATLGMFPCAACSDNVTVCVAVEGRDP